LMVGRTESFEEILLGEISLAVLRSASHHEKLVLRLGQCVFEILAEFGKLLLDMFE